MAKSKPNGEKKPRPDSVMFRLSAEEKAALEAFLKTHRVQPDKTTVVRAALREFLQREGHWPKS